MAEKKGDKGGPSKLGFWIVFLLVVGITAAGSFLYKSSEKARGALADAKREYEEMQQLKRVVAKAKGSRGARLPSPKETGEDLVPFLAKKGAQSGIPQNLFTVARNNPVKQTGWTETSYTVTLRATKETPVTVSSVADFLVAVETERPSVKSRNLNLGFVPSSPDLASVSVTFSQFQRD